MVRARRACARGARHRQACACNSHNTPRCLRCPVTWSLVTPKAEFGRRYSHAAVAHTNASGGQMLWVIGGVCGTQLVAMNDVWEWQGGDAGERACVSFCPPLRARVWKCVCVRQCVRYWRGTSRTRGARARSGLGWRARRAGDLVCARADAWGVVTRNASFAPRASFALAVTSNGSNVYIFGGMSSATGHTQDATVVFDDVWVTSTGGTRATGDTRVRVCLCVCVCVCVCVCEGSGD